MKNWKMLFLVMLAVILSIVLIGCTTAQEDTSTTQNDDNSTQVESNNVVEPQFGGTITVAVPTSPPNLDSDKGTGGEINMIMAHVQEGLFEFNEKFQAIPQLAEDYQVSDDGKTYTIQLRQGVKFHNGKEMTSEDVDASVQRWLRLNGGGQMIGEYLDSFEVTGPYEVVFKFKEPYAPFLNIMASFVANQKLVIRPKEVVEQFGDETITDYTGTGPYKIEEFVPDQYVTVVRFDDYVPSDREFSFYSGKKIAYADQIIFKIIPEDATRIAGVQSGEFDFASLIPQDQYAVFKDNETVKPFILKQDRQEILCINDGIAPFNDVNARQALAYAMDMEDLGRAIVGDETFWSLDGCLFPEGSFWYDANAGKGIYNAKDLDKAKQLLALSNYDGSPIVIVNCRDDKTESQAAIALEAQLEKVGFNVDVQLYDRPTVSEIRSQKEGWNLHFTYFSQNNPDPQVFGAWMGTNGWISNWDDELSKETDEIFTRMMREFDQDKRYTIVQEWYKKFWETTPYIKCIDYTRMDLGSSKLHDYKGINEPYFCNVWKEQ